MADWYDESCEELGRAAAPTLLLHPVTQEVYRVPATALEHDARHPVLMPFDVFEDLASVGCLSAERFLDHERMSANGGFDATQVLAVRLKGHATVLGGKPMYAWATRMTTAVTLPNLAREGSSSILVGREFIWLWPPGKALNAYITRKERQRLDPDETPAGIDAAEPTVRYTMAQPGLTLGPDDIEGCERVPMEELTPEQRHFVLCIKPQQTLFARRPVTQDWTARITRMTDENQQEFADGIRTQTPLRAMLHADKLRVQRMNARLLGHGTFVTGAPLSPILHSFPLTANSRKRGASYMDTELSEEERTVEQQCARLLEPVSMNNKRRRLARQRVRGLRGRAVMERAEEKQLDDEFRERVLRDKRSVEGIKELEYNRRWGALPGDPLVRILCARLGADLVGTARQAADSIATMRLVSKGAREVADRFVGGQLAAVEYDTSVLVFTPGSWGTDDALHKREKREARPTLGELGARVRALGLSPGDVLNLGQTTPRFLGAAEAMRPEIIGETFLPFELPRCPMAIPDWCEYLRLRLKREQRHGARGVVNKPSTAPSKTFVDVIHRLRQSNPIINGERFASLVAGGKGARVPNPAFDEQLRLGGERWRESEVAMLDMAGV